MQYETKHTKYTQINANKSMHSEMGPLVSLLSVGDPNGDQPTEKLH